MASEIEGADLGAALAGSTCGRCGRVSYPAERHGCERCGALPAEIATTPLVPVGTVRSAATVHRHRSSDPPAPFVVVEVVLDAGPVVRSLLVDDDDDDDDDGDGDDGGDGDGGEASGAARRGARVVGTPAGDRIAFTRVAGP